MRDRNGVSQHAVDYDGEFLLREELFRHGSPSAANDDRNKTGSNRGDAIRQYLAGLAHDRDNKIVVSLLADPIAEAGHCVEMKAHKRGAKLSVICGCVGFSVRLKRVSCW